MKSCWLNKQNNKNAKQNSKAFPKQVKIKYPKVAAGKDLTIAGMAADQTQQLSTPTPVESSMAQYFDCGIKLIGESKNTVRIACSKIPSKDIDITISVQQAVSEGGVN